MNARPFSFRDERGMASVALFLFAMVSVLILVANFQLNYAVGSTSDAYDTFSSETTEKNGVAQIVKESILAIGETAITDSGSSLQTEIQNRLSSVTFPAGVTVALDPATTANMPAVPANLFYPNPAPASAQPEYFAATSAGGSTIPAIAGMGNLLTSLAVQGPVSYLGNLTFNFDRANTNGDGSADPNDSQIYTVNADLFSVPLTNVDLVAYGLPTTGSIPTAAPAIPPGSLGSGVSTLIVTSNNPANDSTAYPDLFASSATEHLPYQYRNAVSFSWNAYEYLWSSAYQNALLGAATLNNAIYNFSSPPAPGNMPAGVTVIGNTVTVDCSAVTGNIVAIVDSPSPSSPPGNNVVILGNPLNGSPFILLVRNTGGTHTNVTFLGSNNRPAIFYLENSTVGFTGDPQIQGALFLDKSSTASGTVTWFGHFSFYGPTNPFGTLNLTLADNPAVKSALAALAPRVLLVSTSATR